MARINLAAAWLMLVVAELLAAQEGLAYQIIRDDFRHKQSSGSREEMLAEIRKGATLLGTGAMYAIGAGNGLSEAVTIETEPGLMISGTLFHGRSPGRKPAVLLVDGPPALAEELARNGNVILSLTPRGLPAGQTRRLLGDWLTNTRALMIGRDLAGMRAGDIIRGIDQLASRTDVDATSIYAAARGVQGVWLLMAAAIDPRIRRIWLDRTPYSLRTALDNPLSRDLHDAVVPGFALRWDLQDLVKAVAPREVIWSDPTDWMQEVQPHLEGYLYRTHEETDERFLKELLK